MLCILLLKKKISQIFQMTHYYASICRDVSIKPLSEAHNERHEIKNILNHGDFTVKAQYLKVKIHLKLLVSQSKLADPRKFTLRYH